MKLEYRNVYAGRGNKLRYGQLVFAHRKLADVCCGHRLGIETICRTYVPRNVVVVFYQPTR